MAFYSKYQQTNGIQVRAKQLLASFIKQYKSWRRIGLGLLLPVITISAMSHPQLVLPVPQLTATSQKILTLRDAVMLLIRNNPDLQSQYLQRAITKYNLEIAYNEFAPQYTLGGTATYAKNNMPVYSTDPKIALKSPFGAEFSMDVDNTFSGDGHAAVGTVSVTQPLLRGFGRTVVQNNLFTAKQQDYLGRLALKGNVMQQIVSLVSDYYTLVQDYNDLEVTKASVKISEENLEQTQKKIQVGKAAPADLVQYEQQLAQDDFTISQDNNSIRRDYLQLLSILGLDPNSNLTIVKKITVDYGAVPSKQQAIALALANNVEYQSQLISYRLAKRAVLIAADKLKWQLDLKASASRTFVDSIGVGVMPINGGAGSGDTTQKSLELSLDIPLDDVQSKAGYEQAKIELEQQRIRVAQLRRQTITDVLNGLRDLKAQKEQIDLAQKTVNWGEQNLTIIRKKANFGRATPLDVTNVQNTLSDDQLQLISAQISYINSLQQLYQTLGISLEKWGITIAY